jgi:hypothetical protein
MDPRLSEALAHLPDYFGNHALVSMTALALGLVVSLPLAFACLRRPTLRTVLLSLTSIINGAGTGAVRAVLSVAARCSVASARWFGVSFGPRLPAVRGAGPRALQHAPDPAQHNHRAGPASTRRSPKRRKVSA